MGGEAGQPRRDGWPGSSQPRERTEKDSSLGWWVLVFCDMVAAMEDGVEKAGMRWGEREGRGRERERAAQARGARAGVP